VEHAATGTNAARATCGISAAQPTGVPETVRTIPMSAPSWVERTRMLKAATA
jgi:hypothetical protein